MLPPHDLENDVISGRSLPNPDTRLVWVKIQCLAPMARNKHAVQKNSQTALQCLDTLSPSSCSGTLSNVILFGNDNAAVVVKNVIAKIVTLGRVDDAAWRMGLRSLLQFIEEFHRKPSDCATRQQLCTCCGPREERHAPWKFSSTREGVTLLGRTIVCAL